MTPAAVLAKLKTLGNEATRKHNAKNGAGANQFGVKLGDIRALAKKIKTNHDLAKALWKTKNIDAMLLATLIVNPGELTARELDKWVRSTTLAQVADWLMSYVVKVHADKEALRTEWMADNQRWAARAGWALTAGRVAKSPKGLDLPALLGRIETEMADAPPETQWTMNCCLAEIGINHPKLRKRALATGDKLGVFRDYPCSKGCTSPFAPIWITEIVARQQ